MSESTIVCPFCPLHCDDVSVSSPPDCSILQHELPRVIRDGESHRVGEQTATQEQAEVAAKQHEDAADRVTVIARQATLGQARVMARCGFAIRMEATATQVALQNAIARCGTITATLADVKQHADAMWVLGEVTTATPRLMSMISSPIQHTLIQHTPKPNADTVADFAVAVRKNEFLTEARYVAIIVAPHAFDGGQAGPAMELLVETVIEMNSASGVNSQRANPRRAVLLSLDPLASLRSTQAWSTNERLKIATPDDFRRSTTIRLGSPSPDSHRADIQIGGIDPGNSLAGIYFPAAQAGIHHADAVIRGDGTVTLPLAKITDSRHPSIAGWFAAKQTESRP